MTATLDVNLLVYAADESVDQHPRAGALLDWVATDRSITYLFWPVVLGYLRILTNPAILRAPLTPAEAIGDIEGMLRFGDYVEAETGSRRPARSKGASSPGRPTGPARSS